MKAITILQPYCHLIAVGEKRVENRTWYAPHKLWGEWIAIHAGLSRNLLTAGDLERFPDMSFGAIEAVAFLNICLSRHEIEYNRVPEDMQWVKKHEHMSGPICWIFTKVIRLPNPIRCKGKQGLWTISDGAERRITRAILDNALSKGCIIGRK